MALSLKNSRNCQANDKVAPFLNRLVAVGAGHRVIPNVSSTGQLLPPTEYERYVEAEQWSKVRHERGRDLVLTFGEDEVRVFKRTKPLPEAIVKVEHEEEVEMTGPSGVKKAQKRVTTRERVAVSGLQTVPLPKELVSTVIDSNGNIRTQQPHSLSTAFPSFIKERDGRASSPGPSSPSSPSATVLANVSGGGPSSSHSALGASSSGRVGSGNGRTQSSGGDQRSRRAGGASSALPFDGTLSMNSGASLFVLDPNAPPAFIPPKMWQLWIHSRCKERYPDGPTALLDRLHAEATALKSQRFDASRKRRRHHRLTCVYHFKSTSNVARRMGRAKAFPNGTLVESSSRVRHAIHGARMHGDRERENGGDNTEECFTIPPMCEVISVFAMPSSSFPQDERNKGSSLADGGDGEWSDRKVASSAPNSPPPETSPAGEGPEGSGAGVGAGGGIHELSAIYADEPLPVNVSAYSNSNINAQRHSNVGGLRASRVQSGEGNGGGGGIGDEGVFSLTQPSHTGFSTLSRAMTPNLEPFKKAERSFVVHGEFADCSCTDRSTDDEADLGSLIESEREVLRQQTLTKLANMRHRKELRRRGGQREGSLSISKGLTNNSGNSGGDSNNNSAVTQSTILKSSTNKGDFSFVEQHWQRGDEAVRLTTSNTDLAGDDGHQQARPQPQQRVRFDVGESTPGEDDSEGPPFMDKGVGGLSGSKIRTSSPNVDDSERGRTGSGSSHQSSIKANEEEERQRREDRFEARRLARDAPEPLLSDEAERALQYWQDRFRKATVEGCASLQHRLQERERHRSYVSNERRHLHLLSRQAERAAKEIALVRQTRSSTPIDSSQWEAVFHTIEGDRRYLAAAQDQFISFCEFCVDRQFPSDDEEMHFILDLRDFCIHDAASKPSSSAYLEATMTPTFSTLRDSASFREETSRGVHVGGYGVRSSSALSGKPLLAPHSSVSHPRSSSALAPASRRPNSSQIIGSSTSSTSIGGANPILSLRSRNSLHSAPAAPSGPASHAAAASRMHRLPPMLRSSSVTTNGGPHASRPSSRGAASVSRGGDRSDGSAHMDEKSAGGGNSSKSFGGGIGGGGGIALYDNLPLHNPKSVFHAKGAMSPNSNNANTNASAFDTEHHLAVLRTISSKSNATTSASSSRGGYNSAQQTTTKQPPVEFSRFNEEMATALFERYGTMFMRSRRGVAVANHLREACGMPSKDFLSLFYEREDEWGPFCPEMAVLKKRLNQSAL